jgi:hypothetical protein
MIHQATLTDADRIGADYTRREAHMKFGSPTTFLLLILSVVLAGCAAYPSHYYRSGDGFYYYGPDTYNPTYFGPF